MIDSCTQKIYFHFLLNWREYDRGDSFPFDFEPIGFSFDSILKWKLWPRSYSIQFENNQISMCVSHNGATSRASCLEWHSFLWCFPGCSISDLKKLISASWYMTRYESYTLSVESLECIVLAASDSSFTQREFFHLWRISKLGDRNWECRTNLRDLF